MTILSARAVADMLGMTRHHLNSMAAAGEMRTYVASRLGPCVEVPSELW